jgi:AmiR/NasT family two-component response regulator
VGLWFDLGSALVVIVVVFYVLPEHLYPAVVRWRERRSGRPLAPATARNLAPVLGAVVAVGVGALVVDPDAGRRMALPLAMAAAGVLLAMWQVSRR